MHTWASGQSHTKGGRLVVFAAAVNRLTAVLGRLELRWMGGGYRREREIEREREVDETNQKKGLRNKK